MPNRTPRARQETLPIESVLEPDRDCPVNLFTRLVYARQVGDHKAGIALARRLREVGWSVVAVAPREPWGGR